MKNILTGPDNRTVAIGRLLGSAIAIQLLFVLPAVAAVTVITQTCNVTIWCQFFAALGIYTPLVVGAITGLIWGTNQTEPKPAIKDTNTNG